MNQTLMNSRLSSESVVGRNSSSLIDSSTQTVTIICSSQPLDFTVQDEPVGFFEKVLNFLFNGIKRRTILDKRWD
jgi:hypothetical protein